MSDQNPLDDFLKRKLSERTYSFQESYWDAAEELIEADQKKKKRRGFLWWWIGGLGLLAISVGTVLMWPTGKQSVEQPKINITQGVEALTHSVDSLQIDQNKNTPPRQSELSQIDNNQEKSDILSTHNSSKRNQSHSKQTSLASQGPILLSPKVSQRADKDKHLQEVEKEGSLGQIALTRQMPEDLSANSPALVPTSRSTDASTDITHKDDIVARLGTVDSIQVQEFVLTHTIQQDVQQVSLSPYFRKNYLGIRLGYSAAEGWQNMGSSLSPRSYQGFAGIHYARRLSDRLRLHTGLEYSTRASLNSDSTYRSTGYSFGFRRQFTTISPQKLHSLELPLYLALRIKNRHYLHIGGSASYLLNVSSLVSTGTETDFEAENPIVERAWGYKQGFRSLDASLIAGYQYYLGSGLFIGIQSRYGLRDLTDPAFFGNAASDRNIRWQVSLTYDFLNF